MATTKTLASDDSVYVTTYAGPRGRVFCITASHEGQQVQVVLTQPELFRLLKKHDTSTVTTDLGGRPSFDG